MGRHLSLKSKPNPPRIPPAPSCAAEIQTPPFQKISLGFANPSSRKIVSQNRVRIVLHSACSNTCLPAEASAQAGRAEPRKKNTLSFFKRNFTPTKSEMQEVFFLSGLSPYSASGVRMHSPHFPFWKTLCFAQRRFSARGTLVLHFFLEISSSKCYNNTTKTETSALRQVFCFVEAGARCFGVPGGVIFCEHAKPRGRVATSPSDGEARAVATTYKGRHDADSLFQTFLSKRSSFRNLNRKYTTPTMTTKFTAMLKRCPHRKVAPKTVKDEF